MKVVRRRASGVKDKEVVGRGWYGDGEGRCGRIREGWRLRGLCSIHRLWWILCWIYGGEDRWFESCPRLPTNTPPFPHSGTVHAASVLPPRSCSTNSIDTTTTSDPVITADGSSLLSELSINGKELKDNIRAMDPDTNTSNLQLMINIVQFKLSYRPSETNTELENPVPPPPPPTTPTF